MTCPKCEQGAITKIIFKKSQRLALLCELCGTVWFEGEDINSITGHTIQSITKDDGMEHTFVDIDEKYQESKSVMYPSFK